MGFSPHFPRECNEGVLISTQQSHHIPKLVNIFFDNVSFSPSLFSMEFDKQETVILYFKSFSFTFVTKNYLSTKQ
jgi:hypothetical protein